MNKNNNNLDLFSSNSSSHEHVDLLVSSFSFNVTFNSSSNEWLTDSRASILFFNFTEYNTQQIFVGDDRSTTKKHLIENVIEEVFSVTRLKFFFQKISTTTSIFW